MIDPQKTQKRVVIEVRTTRTGEEDTSSMKQVLESLTHLRKTVIPFLYKKGYVLSLEIALVDQTVRFFVTCPLSLAGFLEAQIISQYPKALLSRVSDYMPSVLTGKHMSLGQMKLNAGFIYPLRFASDFKDVDPLSSVLGVLAKAEADIKVLIQYLLVPVSSSWQRKGRVAMESKRQDATGAVIANPYSAVIAQKIASNGFKSAIRLVVSSSSKEKTEHLLYQIASSFSSFNNPSGNSLVLKKPVLWQKRRLLKAILDRSRRFMPLSQILNSEELSLLYHFPGEKLSTIHNLAWARTILSDAPENLPVADTVDEEGRKNINFFAKTEYKNRQTVFGIKKEDRRRHVYIIGKSGTGKSTLIANMAINDARNREGFCVIDPHGDLSENLLDFIPSYRVNDVIYLDPSDKTRSFAINPLEVKDEAQKELVASGIVAIFKKLYGTSWGPRLEYILRNTIVSVIEMPNPTLLMVPEMLANPNFRKKVVENLSDPVLKSFWLNEFEQMTDKLRVESISPIQNKVGQFTSSQRIRNIIGHPKSSIDIEKVMNEGKILILNLSQGFLGEDNAALLGAMIITKIQLAAMNRVAIPENQRRDFYLYVDEFQNFATTSFIKILSEARKFRLCLILANQYIAQVPEDVRAAIFGNAGTILSFLVGAADASYMAKEFKERFKEEDLLALGNYQAIIKLYIEGITQSPFHCYSLPLPYSRTQNRAKILRLSRERYTRPLKTS